MKKNQFTYRFQVQLEGFDYKSITECIKNHDNVDNNASRYWISIGRRLRVKGIEIPMLWQAGIEMFEAMYNVLVSGICGVVIVIFRCKIASEWYDILRCCGTESRPTSWEVRLVRTCYSADSIIFNRLEMTKLLLLRHRTLIFYRYRRRFLLSFIYSDT